MRTGSAGDRTPSPAVTPTSQLTPSQTARLLLPSDASDSEKEHEEDGEEEGDSSEKEHDDDEG